MKNNKSKIVFISYAKEDIDAARNIFEIVEKNTNFTPWLDEKFLLPGMDWEYEIMNTIENSTLIILVISHNSINKIGFVQKELKKALDRLDYFPTNKIFLIPILIEKCIINEPRLKRIQYIEFYTNSFTAKHQLIKTFEHIEHLNEPSKSKINIVDKEDEVKEILLTTRDFSGKDCRNYNFEGLNLTHTSFKGANLIGANFKTTNLSYADMSYSNMERADLTDADIAYADFTSVNLWGGRIIRTKNITKVKSCEFLNLYYIQNYNNEEEQFNKQSKTIISLSNYGDFVDFYCDTLHLNKNEFVKKFPWIKLEYFTKMFTIETF